MHKQRSKRVGSTFEARKRHYEGKAFSTRKAKKVHKSDWNSLAMGAKSMDEANPYAMKLRRELVAKKDLHWDMEQYSKPEHAKRAVDIQTCFPKMVLSSDSEGHQTLMEKLAAKFGRK